MKKSDSFWEKMRTYSGETSVSVAAVLFGFSLGNFLSGIFFWGLKSALMSFALYLSLTFVVLIIGRITVKSPFK